MQNKFQPGDDNQLPPKALAPIEAYPPARNDIYARGGYPVLPMENVAEGSLIEYWRALSRRRGTLILFASVGILIAILITLPQAPI